MVKIKDNKLELMNGIFDNILPDQDGYRWYIIIDGEIKERYKTRKEARKNYKDWKPSLIIKDNGVTFSN
jgi:hypothetical protein